MWLACMAITGIALSFSHEIDAMLNPELSVAWRGSEPVLGLQDAWTIAGSAGGRVARIDLPEAAGAPIVVDVRADRPSSDNLRLMLHPGSGAVLGTRYLEDPPLDRRHMMGIVHRVHTDLLLGPAAAVLIGTLAILWAAQQGAGIALAFTSVKQPADAFRVRRGAKGHKLVMDVHRAGGLWILPATLLLALTGAAMSLYTQYEQAIGALAPQQELATAIARLPRSPDAFTISLDQALAAATSKAAGDRLDRLDILAEEAVYGFRFHSMRDLGAPGGRIVYVDMRSGRILADQHETDLDEGRLALALPYPVHTGQILGPPGRYLLVLTGVGILVLTITGLAIWRKKSRARSFKRTA